MPSPGYPPIAASALELSLTSGATYKLGGQPITVRGVGASVSISTTGNAPATLDAEGLSRHFVVEDGAMLTLQNLIITGGYESGEERSWSTTREAVAAAEGGSIVVNGRGSALRLFGVHMHSNSVEFANTFLAQRGGSIFATEGTALNISRSLFTNCTSAGGGAVAAVASVVHIRDTVFKDSLSSRGGAVQITGDGFVTGKNARVYISDCTFEDCVSISYGGGMYLAGANTWLDRVTFRRCSVPSSTTSASIPGGGGLIIFGGLPLPLGFERTETIMKDVTFEDCFGKYHGGGLSTYDYRNAASDLSYLRMERVHFKRCSAGGKGGGFNSFYSLVDARDLTFQDCESLQGGAVSLEGAKVPAPAVLSELVNRGILDASDSTPLRFSNCFFARCVATATDGLGGGAIVLSAAPRAILEDSSIVNCSAKNRGGGIFSTQEAETMLTLRRVTFSGTGAVARSGALAVYGQVLVYDCHFIGVYSFEGGLSLLNAPINLTMIGGSIIGASGSDNSGSLPTASVFSIYGGDITLINMIIDDCDVGTGGVIITKASASRLTMRGCRITRSGASQSAAFLKAWGGALEMPRGEHTIEHSTIDGDTFGQPSTPRSMGCLNIVGASVTLRNVTLSRCSQLGNTRPASLRTSDDSAIVGSFVTVIPPCGETTPTIGHESGGATLALRHLRVSPEEGCSLPNVSQLVSPGYSIAKCADLPAISGASCGAATTCTDEAIFSLDPSLTSATCSCAAGAFTRDTADAALLPYDSGCFTERVASSVRVQGVTASSVIFRLSKGATMTSDDTMVQTLDINMAGTDTERGAVWEIGSVPSWLDVPIATGSLSKSDLYGRFNVSASTSGMQGRDAPYQATLNVSTISGRSRQFAVPVLLYVLAVTVDAAWGIAGPSASCANATAPDTSVFAGSSTAISFIGCDREGLANARPANFMAIVQQQGAGSNTSAPVEYDALTGAFSATFQPPTPGAYTIVLLLSGKPIGTPLFVIARGCPDGFEPNPDSAQTGEACKPCEGGICDAAATVETIRMESGYWRLTNKTTDTRRCEYHDNPDKTPCPGQTEVGAPMCVSSAYNQHGPLCTLCGDTSTAESLGSYYDDGRCEPCPDASGRVGAIVGIIAAIIAVLALLAYVYYRPPSALSTTSARMHRITRILEPLGLWPKLKQMIGFFQVIFSLGAVYRANLPKEFYDALAWLNWITFDVFELYPVACIGDFSSRILLTAILPIGVIAVTVPLAIVIGKLLGTVRAGASFGGAFALVVVWALTPPVSKMLFQVFDCEPFGFSDGALEAFNSSSVAVVEQHFMFEVMRIRCSDAHFASPEHDQLKGLAGAFLAVWPVGMPLLLAALLVRARKKSTKSSSGTPRESLTILERATMPLSREYDPHSYYWEVLELLRRLVISAVLLTIPSTSGMARLAVAIVTCFLYCILLFTVRPFKRLDDTIVAAATNVLLVFTFLTMIYVKVFDDIANNKGASTYVAQQVMGFSTSFDIAMTLIGLGFAQVFIVAAVIFFKLKLVVDAESIAQQNRNKERVLRAIQSKNVLRHPAVFIAYNDLRPLGKFVQHEEARGLGVLHMVDTYEMLLEFTQKETTLFVSHQWLSYTRPDTADGTQFRALCDACDELCHLQGIAPSKLFLWIECAFAIRKQHLANATLQKLAVESLAVYASTLSYFLVLAPDATHADSLKMCDQESYGRRGWCRLEQWAHSTGGFTSMYVFGRARRLELSTQQDLLKDAMFVFEGDFTNHGDKKRLVDTVLGLWSLMCSKKESSFEVQLLYSRLKTNENRVFPSAYFGDLPTVLEKQMTSDPSVANDDTKERRGTLQAASLEAAAVERQSTRFTADNTSAACKSTMTLSNIGAGARTAPVELPPPVIDLDPGLDERLRAAEERARASEERALALEAKASQLDATREENQILAARLQKIERAADATPSGAMVVRAPSPSPALRGIGSSAVPPPTIWEQISSRAPGLDSNSTPLVAEIRLLAALCDVDMNMGLTSDLTIRRVIRWSEEEGTASVHDIVSAHLIDEFVAALQLKRGPARVLSEALGRADAMGFGSAAYLALARAQRRAEPRALLQEGEGEHLALVA